MEIFRALGAAIEPPSAEVRRLSEVLDLGPMPEPAAHTDLFDFQLYPYASVYLGTEGQLGGEARERIAGFLKTLGCRLPSEPDHLIFLLACLAELSDVSRSDADTDAEDGRAQHALSALLWEHLLSWLPFYLDRLLELAPPFYQRWAHLLDEALQQLALHQRQLHTSAAARLPLHLRALEPLPPTEDLAKKPLLALILSPARSAMILTRNDLFRAAKELQLGARIGERRFVLEALLSQDAAATCDWLIREARRQAERHLRHRDWLGSIAEDWHSRALAFATFLEHIKPEPANVD